MNEYLLVYLHFNIRLIFVVNHHQKMQAGVLLDIIGKANKLPNNEESISTSEFNTNSTLNVNDTFNDWDAVEIAVNTYAKQNGFVAIKYRKELDAIDKSITRRRVYNCWKS